MAKASRVAARQVKALKSVEERLEMIELMLEAIMTKKQREQFEALVSELDEEPVQESHSTTIAMPSWTQEPEPEEPDDTDS